MPDASILGANADVTARLEALAGRLSDRDLARDLGGDWTVATALAHVAFWDRRTAFVLQRWSNGGAAHVELDDEVVNGALEGLLQAIDPHAAARLAVESAKRADAAIAMVPDAIASQIDAVEAHRYLLRRSNHRLEHIEQIEAGLR
ncbi:MAG TPA: hypothetical protein VFY10_07025 [Dehalococcoidia bacterium]|nr:hypothetical protein [Dehalococcoidia bacterium]